ncbi:pentapeptide repeat-containing protein [Tychonema sp. LEGE 07199]|uniref:TerD family protein n=1 Tax=unclassified Tychonema TaxID=2642144 RepID=UPI00187EE497|nr:MULTISPECIES: TerD family protein [unclassified Tychonema]MBE9123219.1 pentapeptide repeat-containing protein [Tychonema sp. LEGE 07199]MBE9134866.1 pentapeptide repeat-containing protein [Tychonema sp. LEGE 07196]
MTIELTKGDRFNLSKEAPDFKKVAIALGWQVSQTAQNCDIDASVFMLGADGRIPDEKYFVFYNNLTSPDGAARHSGDSRNGQVEGDDETVYLDLSKINSAIQEIVFVVTLHEGQEKNQSFSQVTNAFIRLYNSETGNELVRYNLNQIFSQETALEFGRLYRKNGEWRFQAVGQGYNAGLQSFVDKYYVENAVDKSSNAGEKVDDAEVLRQFSDRVDRLLREEAIEETPIPASSEAVEQPAAIAVNADTLESEEEAKIDDSALENLEPAITSEEFWKRYEEGERDFTGINLAGVNLSGKTLDSNVSLSQANLSSANLANANLTGINLIGANLQEANLNSTNLHTADLIEVNLSGANLTQATLYCARLIQGNLSQANLSEAKLDSANLTTANLSRANLTQASLHNVNLTGADLSQAKVTKVNLSYANLSGVNLNGVSLIGVNLAGVNLSNMNLSGVSLTGTNLSQANLTGINLSGAILTGAYLRGANLDGANLTGVNLVGVNFESVNLSGQNFSGFNLSGVNLSFANLSAANLASANLCGANLSYANLEKANLKDANLVGANMDRATLAGAIMPDGTIHE